MEIAFEVAENSDLEMLLELIQEYYKYDAHPFDDDKIRTALVELLSDRSLGRVWLLQDNSEAIGYIVLTFGFSLESGGRDALLDELYIRERYRGQGIGRKVIQFLEEICQSLDIQVLNLEVERRNTFAQSFYRQVGFDDQDSYLMTKWMENRSKQ